MQSAAGALENTNGADPPSTLLIDTRCVVCGFSDSPSVPETNTATKTKALPEALIVYRSCGHTEHRRCSTILSRTDFLDVCSKCYSRYRMELYELDTGPSIWTLSPQPPSDTMEMIRRSLYDLDIDGTDSSGSVEPTCTNSQYQYDAISSDPIYMATLPPSSNTLGVENNLECAYNLEKINALVQTGYETPTEAAAAYAEACITGAPFNKAVIQETQKRLLALRKQTRLARKEWDEKQTKSEHDSYKNVVAATTAPADMAHTYKSLREITNSGKSIYELYDQDHDILNTIARLHGSWSFLLQLDVAKFDVHEKEPGQHFCRFSWRGFQPMFLKRLCASPFNFSFAQFFENVCNSNWKTFRNLRPTEEQLEIMAFSFVHYPSINLDPAIMLCFASLPHLSSFMNLGMTNDRLSLLCCKNRKVASFFYRRYNYKQL